MSKQKIKEVEEQLNNSAALNPGQLLKLEYEINQLKPDMIFNAMLTTLLLALTSATVLHLLFGDKIYGMILFVLCLGSWYKTIPYLRHTYFYLKNRKKYKQLKKTILQTYNQVIENLGDINPKGISIGLVL